MGSNGRDRDELARESGADPLAVTVAGDADERSGQHDAALPAGTLLGRYVVTGVLGRGGMGVVYAAHDPDLDRPVAIKLLRRELRAARARLLREGQAIAKLTHPNVVTVHDVGAHGDDMFIAMERVRGQTLGAWIRGHAGDRRPWRQVLERLVPAGRGLAAAHAAGLVHRDFKPENVLLGDDGRVVVTDFGLAQVGDEAAQPGPARPATLPPVPGLDVTQTGAVLGTPAYMSPEQARGERADARSDQFSFCVTLHEALLGVRPFIAGEDQATVPNLASGAGPGPGPRTAPPPRHLPRWLRRALARGLAVDPERRFPSMTALLAALRPPRRTRVLVAAGALTVVAAAGAALALTGGRDRADLELSLAARYDARCATAAAAAETVWDAAARERYRGVPRIAPRDDELAWLDDYARRWSALRREACLASDPGEAGGAAALHPRTEACLDEALAALRVAVARTDLFWPVLPAIDDCRRAPRHAVTFPVAVGVGPQGVAALSPDASRIAVSSLAGEPYVVAADPRVPQTTAVAGARLVGDWLPDGRQLLQLPDGQQVLRDADGGPDVALPGRGDLLFTQINTLAPAGDRVAVADDHGVAVLAAAGGRELHHVAGAAHELAWEPDGRRLAIVTRDLSRLILLDTRTGATARLAIGLHSRGLGEIGLAWLAPGRLALSGAIGPGATFGVWTLELDEASRLRRGPELRYQPAAGVMLRLFDAAAGHLLLHDASGRQRLLRWRGDHVTEYPAHFKDVRVMAIDRRTGTALGLSRDTLHLFDVDSTARTIVAAGDAIHLFGGLRDGRPYQAHKVGDGRWELVERTASGDGERIAFAWSADTPYVRCAPDEPTACVVVSRGGDVLHAARLDGTRLGPVQRWDGITGAPDVARDGRRLFAPALGGAVVELDLATAARRPLAATDEPCTPRMVRQDADVADRFWIVLLCADRFAIGAVAPGVPYREVVASDGWISGLEVLPGGDLVFSSMDWDPQLLLLDGF